MRSFFLVSIALTFILVTDAVPRGRGQPPECPAEDGEFVTLIPHDDCTKFWKCDRGTAVEQECPAGLEFNPTLLVCDYPEDAGCTPGNGGGTGGNGGKERDGDDGENGRGQPPECPAEDGEFVTHIPHDDCTKFWKCYQGTPVEFDCPPGLEFNPILLVCDYPEHAGCTPGNGGGTGGYA